MPCRTGPIWVSRPTTRPSGRPGWSGSPTWIPTRSGWTVRCGAVGCWPTTWRGSAGIGRGSRACGSRCTGRGLCASGPAGCCRARRRPSRGGQKTREGGGAAGRGRSSGAPTRRRPGPGCDPGRCADARGSAPAAGPARARGPVPARRGRGRPAPDLDPGLVPRRPRRPAAGAGARQELQAVRLWAGGLARRPPGLSAGRRPPRRAVLRSVAPGRCPLPLARQDRHGDLGQPGHPHPQGVAAAARAAGRTGRTAGAGLHAHLRSRCQPHRVAVAGLTPWRHPHPPASGPPRPAGRRRPVGPHDHPSPRLYPDRPMPAVLWPLHEDPGRHLPEVVEAMNRYWQAAVEPVWQRLQALCMADLSYRMERFGIGGISRVLEDLHPEISFLADQLRIDKPHHCHHRFDLTGTGLLLVPCVFSWPTLIVGCCGQARPVLIYPPRGVAELCEQSRAEQTDPLCALVGRTRATLLAMLDLPRTTTQLAEQLDLSPAAVSQHLKILKDTALVTGRRRGRMVLYQRTAAATALMTAIQSDEAAG